MIPALKGFALSTIAAAALSAIGVILVCVVGGADGCTAGFNLETAEAFLACFAFLTMFAAVGVAILTLPLTLVLSKLGAERASAYSFLGLLIGIAFTFLIPGPIDLRNPTYLLSMLVVGGLPGAAAGIVWWRMDRMQGFKRAAQDA